MTCLQSLKNDTFAPTLLPRESLVIVDKERMQASLSKHLAEWCKEQNRQLYLFENNIKSHAHHSLKFFVLYAFASLTLSSSSSFIGVHSIIIPIHHCNHSPTGRCNCQYSCHCLHHCQNHRSRHQHIQSRCHYHRRCLIIINNAKHVDAVIITKEGHHIWNNNGNHR
jgi:hypothetical protein